jgi:hypothetical protein
MLGLLAGAIGAGASLYAGAQNRKAAAKANQQNYNMQKEFAQSGIQWKVADAKKAGIHPLAALGAQTHSANPSFVPGDYSGVGSAGQDISRAIQSTASASGRSDAYNRSIRALGLRRMELENNLLAAQIAKVTQAGQPPALPTDGGNTLLPGQGDARVAPEKMRQEMSHAKDPTTSPGMVTDTSFINTKYGYQPVMSKQAKERLEEDIIGWAQWQMRNRLPQVFGSNLDTKTLPKLPKGYKYKYNPFYGTYQKYRYNPKR